MSTNRSLGIKPLQQLTSSYSWAYYQANEGGGDGTGTSLTIANDARATTLPDFDIETAITTQWSARNGWFTNLGSSGISKARSASPTAMDAVFNCGNGCMLIGLQVMGNTSVSREAIIHIGGDSGAQQFGIWMFKETSDRPGFLIRDDANNQGTLQFLGAGTPVTFDGVRSFNLFLLIDNRAGQKTANGYGQDASDISSGVSAGTAVDLTALGSIPLNSANGTPAVYFGRKGGTVPNRMGGELRRVFVMNFGQDKPSNITDVINSLHRSGMIPGWDLPSA